MKTVFLRVLEADEDEKAALLRAAIHSSREVSGRTRFEADSASFSAVTRSPFAYWASEHMLTLFGRLPRLQSGGTTAVSGGKTLDDFRWIRTTWEVRAIERTGWRGFAKGGSFAHYYSDIHLLLDWRSSATALKAYLVDYREKRGWSPNWTAELHGSGHYFRPGLTWPRRTQGGLSLRVMPAGCIFGDKGPALFVEGDMPTTLLSLAGITNSRLFRALVELQMAFGSYEVGVLQRTPVPDLTPEDEAALANLARRTWSLKRQLDTINPTSHAFALPALLQVETGSLLTRADAWNCHAADALTKLDRLKAEIDDRCFALYGIDGEDRRRIERGFGTESETSVEEDEEDVTSKHGGPLVEQLLSWSVGVALGRFDLRLATGERPMPVAPEPFGPLPACSPGMLTGDDGLPLAVPPESYPIAFPEDGILVDDPGHARDLVTTAHAVFEEVFDDGDARWREAAELMGASNLGLRRWFARDLFPLHIKTYSKSRRKAPIYWQLATASASYSVWVYYHRFTRETLFRVTELADLKLQHEESKLTLLIKDAGSDPSRSQRAEIDVQETLVTELRSFKAEVDRVRPLWNPDLNDGVILNFAPLWRLVPHHKSWQREVKKIWDKLVAGDYDWSHLAMHLWPERVVPNCRDDRSLAIAHGLEDDFWNEDDGGKWKQRHVAAEKVQELIAERASSAVKAALGDLLSAPTPSAAKLQRPKNVRRRPRARAISVSTPSPRTQAGSKPPPKRAAPAVEQSTLDAVRDAIGTVAGGAAKSDVLAATGLSSGQWTAAINALLAEGTVIKTGAKRGTRYHVKE